MSPKALIIDDNLANIEVLEQALRLANIVPHSASSMDALMTTLDAIPRIDVVFLDLAFGQISGLELVKDLKQDDRLAQVPIVAYTVLIGERNEAHHAGFHSFLGKPLNLEIFPSQIQRILSGEQVWELNQ